MIVPILDEAKHLADSVQHLLAQDYPGEIDIVLALGPSTDGTDAVAANLARLDARVGTVPNPSGRTPEGLNRAIAAARFDIIARVDAHSLIPPDYLRRAVITLTRTGADNVGGVMAAEGSSPFEQAVATAMTSRLGVGTAAFHVGGVEGRAETVYLGCFRRSALERVGGFDETFTRAQDWELNHRIRATGGVVWFTPELRVTYRPRPSAAALARQYYNYGRWRREVMRRHPETMRRRGVLRYLAPPALVVWLGIGVLGGLLGLAKGPGRLELGWVAPVSYLVFLVGAALGLASGLSGRAALRLPVALATMHIAWGIGFLRGGGSVRRRPGTSSDVPRLAQ